jgi:hypothetical protein
MGLLQVVFKWTDTRFSKWLHHQSTHMANVNCQTTSWSRQSTQQVWQIKPCHIQANSQEKGCVSVCTCTRRQQMIIIYLRQDCCRFSPVATVQPYLPTRFIYRSTLLSHNRNSGYSITISMISVD